MAELDALRRAGRARGVDQRDEVIGADLRQRCFEVEVAADRVEREYAGRWITVDDDHVLEFRQLRLRGQHVVQERLLGDDDAGPGVAEQHRDLLG